MNAGKLVCLASLLCALASASALGQSGAAPPAPVDASLTQSVRIIPPKVARSLKIARIPGGGGVPLVVGTYWSCFMDSGFEICRIKLVVCTNDQSYCVQVN